MIKAAFNKKVEGLAINIGSNSPITLNDLANTILGEYFSGGPVHKKFKPSYLPARPQEVKHAYCSHGVAEKFLDFKPQTDLATGVKGMINWARGSGPQQFTYLASMDLEHSTTPKTWKAKLI